VEIDLNVRVRGNWTFTGIEDADGPVTVGDIVRVVEPESGLEGSGRVEEVDAERRLIFLSVDWASIAELPPALTFDDLVALGVRAVSSAQPGVAFAPRNLEPRSVSAVSAVACSV